MTTIQHTEFTSITKQAKAIAYLYKLVGLYSIVLLTVVTIISMTNIFTAGAFAQYTWTKNTWAFIFSLAIDVNIVRLFIEARIERSKSAYTIGLGLAAVTGAALLIEGLQQSIGVQWSSQGVQSVIALLIAFRVVFVVVLMAREGYKLGKLIEVAVKPPVQESVLPEQDTTSKPEQVYTPSIPLEIEQERTEERTPVHPEKTKRTPLKVVHSQDTNEQKIRELLEHDRSRSARSIAKQVKCSPSTANKWRTQILSEQEDIRLSGTGGQ
jgi:hypothetical protein